MVLYHGTDEISANKIINNGINPKEGKKRADFGQGFYATPKKQHAIDRAQIKSKREGSPPVLIVLEFDELSAEGEIKHFSEANLEWLQFVVNNRIGTKYVERHNLPQSTHNRDSKYDVVIGDTADEDLVYLIMDIKSKDRLVKEEDLIMAGRGSLGVQYSFHTSIGISNIKGNLSIEYV